MADLAVDPAQLPGARGGRRAGLRASPCRSSCDDGDRPASRAVRIAEVHGARSATAGGSSPWCPGTERELPADLVLLAIGFEGTEQQPLLAQFGAGPQPARRRRLRTGLADRRRRACSSPATCTAAPR